MDIWGSVFGYLRIQITTADPQGLINSLLKEEIEIFEMFDGNDLTVSFKIKKKDWKRVRQLVRSANGNVRIIQRLGYFWTIRRVVLRPMVLMLILILAVTIFYIPGRIFFVQVQGNDSIPVNLILSYAQECGIQFGASRALVRSESVKNMLTSKIPQLQWVGINTHGCVAIISVREKSEDLTKEVDNRVRSIVAKCDGVVEQCTVYKGNVLCAPGSAVRAGQVLVSAYTDCGFKIQATSADAEIYGTTKHDLQVVTPAQMTTRKESTDEKRKYSLIIGKKQIKFYKDSGISAAQCVKMKETRYLLLPGGFQLPVALVVERIQTYKNCIPVSMDSLWVEPYAENYLRSVMGSGRITNSEVSVDILGEVINLSGVYDCYELIGIPKYEETIE